METSRTRGGDATEETGGIDNVELVEVAARSAIRAGRYLADQFHRGIAARQKTGVHEHDVVTAADGHAEALIRQELTAAFPASVIVGEEEGASGTGEIRWYVDPIDGTHNFSRGIPLFCCSIGMTVRGEPVGGCVYDPIHDELYTTDGRGVRLNGVPAPAPPARPVPMVLTDIPNAGVTNDPVELSLFTALLAKADVRRIGSSALALAYVASGRADLAVNADVFAWDIAAGGALVTAAGGTFVAVPDEPRTTRPGGFIAWRQGFDELGTVTLNALKNLPALR
ncbi:MULTISPECIES: inositol monophosphatase family protein [Thermomonosporaceae]|uniref:inositol monophosphatase family protein n=1 Tax=Thermomonosporaceae TaxID=2012 RepID=UPI00255A8256|nr:MULTISPECIES: inositol monophosphatase family protein [Thermomonosporaceae]MDL4774205.1 inositol monophosphatase family protein [Actinomadura xylanilytica]